MASERLARRQDKRLGYLCEVECETQGQVSVNRITNLSASGAWIEISDPPAQDSVVTLSFSVGSVTIKAEAKVIRRLQNEGMGVAFQRLSSQYREAIEALSADTCREGQQTNLTTLHKIMTTQVVTVKMDEKLKTLQELFDLFCFHHLLVVDDDGNLVGIVSDRDLLKAVSPFVSTLAERFQDLRTLEKRVHQIMSRTLIMASGDQTMLDAAIVMLNNNISCLPVVSAQRKIEGIVTWKDIFKWMVKQLQ